MMRDVDLRKNLYALSCSQVARHMHFYVREKSGRLFIDMSVMEESKTFSRSFCTDISWISKCAREIVRSSPGLQSCISCTHSRQGGRVGGYFSTCLKWKREQNVLAITVHGRPFFPRDRSVQEECAKRIPTALALLSFRGVFPFFVVFHQVHQETGGCTANDSGFEPRCSCCDACPLLTDFPLFSP